MIKWMNDQKNKWRIIARKVNTVVQYEARLLAWFLARHLNRYVLLDLAVQNNLSPYVSLESLMEGYILFLNQLVEFPREIYNFLLISFDSWFKPPTIWDQLFMTTVSKRLLVDEPRESAGEVDGACCHLCLTVMGCLWQARELGTCRWA